MGWNETVGSSGVKRTRWGWSGPVLCEALVRFWTVTMGCGDNNKWWFLLRHSLNFWKCMSASHNTGPLHPHLVRFTPPHPIYTVHACIPEVVDAFSKCSSKNWLILYNYKIELYNKARTGILSVTSMIKLHQLIREKHEPGHKMIKHYNFTSLPRVEND